MQITRRNFIHMTTAAGAGVLAHPLGMLATPLQTETRPGYELMIFGTSWGYERGWDQFAEDIRKDGYNGTEMWYPPDEAERKKIVDAFVKRGLKIGYLVGAQESDYDLHFMKFRESLEAAASQNPVYINCHSGRDHFTFDQNRSFIELGIEVSKKTGVPVFHETHRSRILFAAPVARQHFEANPEVRITLDISHWCNVHESYLDDQPDAITEALSRTGHIHARIGHPEGPQVSDPRAPEWKNALEKHVAWWDKVVERHKQEGKRITFLTEFGPPDYMPTLPYTRQPLGDQWAINKFMLDILRSRYT